MHSVVNMRPAAAIRRNRFSYAIQPLGILVFLVTTAFALPVPGATSTPTKIAVFEFELEDVSAAGAASKVESAADLFRMQLVTREARRVLRESGRYSLVDTAGVNVEAVKERTLRNCNGCDSAIALTLGADLSLIGVVTRVAQTEYYASLQITDTKTGKVVNQQNAFFTGADDAWASGVRLLLKHGVLADAN
jgi:Protein of unknown function (DUF2380)